jgi:hypothetical protein
MTLREPDDANGATIMLTPLVPDARRADRTRVLCREKLGRQHRRRTQADAVKERVMESVAVIALGVCCALYAFALVVTTLQIEGVVR